MVKWNFLECDQVLYHELLQGTPCLNYNIGYNTTQVNFTCLNRVLYKITVFTALYSLLVQTGYQPDEGGRSAVRREDPDRSIWMDDVKEGRRYVVIKRLPTERKKLQAHESLG